MNCPERCATPHAEESCYVCRTCGVDKGPDGFYRNRTGRQAGQRTSRECRQCSNARRVRNTDPEKNRAKSRAWREEWGSQATLGRHGLTGEAYDELLERQGGGCGICGTTEVRRPGSTRFSIDHDHSCCPGRSSCGKCIRGLLCVRCNSGLGMFGDDINRLEAAIAYLGLVKK